MESRHDSKILIVDDIEHNIKILKSILEKSGYVVSVARSGPEALAFLETETIDLIIMDIMMPEMDGIETCKEIKSRDDLSEIPVIFITALSETPEKIRAFEAGGVDYIDRPFVREEVLARINVHIRLKDYMAKLKELSVTDELTGAFNRRFAYQIMERQIKLARRENSSFVVCYLDIDNLKKVNDTCGHETGDELIITTVNELNAIIRKSDFVFRMGGDEFLILFPHAKLEESYNLIKRIRNKLKKQKVNDAQIDFSFGFSEYSARNDVTVDRLIKKADALMYEEKMKKKKEGNTV